MPDKTACPRCQKTGFVQVEHVITGGKSYRSCYCGECHYQWQTAETGDHVPSGTDDRPDRSRPQGRTPS